MPSDEAAADLHAIKHYASNAAELLAAYEHIAKLEASLAEMVGIYWGDGDGIHPPPACIQRAQALISETVQ